MKKLLFLLGVLFSFHVFADTSSWSNLPLDSLSWKNPVTASSALPTSGNTKGDMRLALDTLDAYVWNGSAWILWNPSGGGGSPGGSSGDIQYNDGSGGFGGDISTVDGSGNYSGVVSISSPDTITFAKGAYFTDSNANTNSLSLYTEGDGYGGLNMYPLNSSGSNITMYGSAGHSWVIDSGGYPLSGSDDFGIIDLQTDVNGLTLQAGTSRTGINNLNPQYVLDIYDYSGASSSDIGNSTTGNWNISTEGYLTVQNLRSEGAISTDGGNITTDGGGTLTIEYGQINSGNGSLSFADSGGMDISNGGGGINAGNGAPQLNIDGFSFSPSAGWVLAYNSTGSSGGYAAYVPTDPTTLPSAVMTSNATGTATFNSNGQTETIYDSSSSTVTSLTITLPTVSQLGQILRYVTAAVVTSVTVSGTVSIGAPITTLAANSSVAWQAVDTSGTFIRIQ